jgi:hypothetical protein
MNQIQLLIKVLKLSEDQAEMRKKLDELTAKARKHIASSNFVFPKEKRYPIHDLSHARNALARASGKPEEAKVRAAVYRKYPALKKRSEKK